MGETSTVTIIILAAVATYATRSLGHVVLSRFKTIPPRIEAALNAVPAAVLTTIVVPYGVFSGVAEFASLLVAGLAAFYLPPLGMIGVGWLTLVALRALV
ncbi:MAG: AzlD domain-containing protein [Ahrensia sp.]